MVNNELDYTTIPCGKIKEYEDGDKNLFPFFDFFNYSGLHSSVKIMLLPQEYIYDISVDTDYNEKRGIITYKVKTSGNNKITLELKNENDKIVATNSGKSGKIKISNVDLWNLVGILVVLCYGSLQVYRGATSSGIFVVFFRYLPRLYNPIT